MKLRKFGLIFLIVLLLFSMHTNAEESASFIQYNDTGKPVGWLQDCICVTETLNGTPWFGDETLSALESFQREQGLEVSCEFDSETLCALLDLSPASADDLVWIPMHGGEKFHENYWCSGMIEPRQMPVECAECFDFTPCKRCY